MVVVGRLVPIAPIYGVISAFSLNKSDPFLSIMAQLLHFLVKSLDFH
jgi:hypothetical protein